MEIKTVDWSNIPQVQAFITWWAEHTFEHRSDHHVIYKLMVHEIPEMMMHKKNDKERGPELADCFILLMDLASLWNVNLADAIRDKMFINMYRVWKQDEHGIMQHVEDDPNVRTKLGIVDDSYPPVGTYPCIMCHSMDHLERLTPEEINDLMARDGECMDNTRCNNCRITFDSTVPF